MENFLIFLRDNWKFLVEVSIPLVSLIVLCFVKKTKITLNPNVWCLVNELLPKWIQAAEDEFGAGHGNDKLKFVLKTAVSFIAARIGLDEKSCLDRFGNDLVNKIECILETPQKKGDQ